MAKNYLCVGGPRAGRRYQTRDGCSYFKAAVPPERPVVHPYDMDPPDITYVSVEYNEQVFFVEGQRIVVWAPNTQTPKATIDLLLESYETNHQTRR